MPDRVIRDELLQSGRWLDLPTDSHRLIYENLLLLADDYGNFEGGPRRLFRWMHGFTQIKTEIDAIKVMSDLQDADMALRYDAEGKEYWHLTRFKNSRKYWTRKFPTSPYHESDKIPTKQENVKNPDPVRTPIEPRTPGGVGVGVGVGVNPLAPSGAFEQFWSAYPRKKSKGQAEKAWKHHANGNIEIIMTALKLAIQSPDWLKDNGKFIPYPATWLNSKGWLDEQPTPPSEGLPPLEQCKQWVV